ncbi:MAG: acyl-CoA thioesterase [Pirellulaceae bacterium]|nr:MAG: acyl-CoA thioesterase [Pirellulaceae bacterium]
MNTLEHTIEIRVRYSETDAQGRVHHAQYLNYFERGRVELLRAMGHSYRDLEATGLMLVVSEMHVKYLGAAQFDDLLRLTTTVTRTRGTRIDHAYRIALADQPEQPIVEATSVIACIDRSGKVRPLPAYLRLDSPPISHSENQ